MGFKCSVLGHQFAEPGLVNEREERGDEVINIKRKVIVCSVCGEQRVLAERKEITKQTDTDSEHDVTEETDESVSVEVDESVREESVPVEADGTEESSGFAGVDVLDSDTDETGGTTAEKQQPVDDSMILSDVNGEPQPGSEWTTGPNTDAEDSWHPATEETNGLEETASEPITAATDDGEILTSTATETTENETASRASDGVAWNEPLTTDGTQTPSNIMGEMLSCSTCDFSVMATDSPFRSGDICPRCHDAYLTETTSEQHSDRVSGCRQSTE